MKVGLLCAVLLASSVAAQPPAAAPPAGAPSLASLVEAERNFASLSRKLGQPAAFLAYFADEVVTFQPMAVMGKDGLRKAALAAPNPLPRQLDWEPWVAGIADSGDLGYTTGPTLSTERATGKPMFTGWYFSVWKHDAYGWRVAADIGVQAPGVEALRPSPLDTVAPSTSSAERGKGTKETLLAAEEALEKRARSGPHAEAYAPYLTAEARLYRDGMPPALGPDAIRVALSQRPSPLGWQTKFAAVSAAGDLAYSHGAYNVPPGSGGDAAASFLHVWRAGPKGWRLAAEVVTGKVK